MKDIVGFFTIIGIYAIFITPFTLVFGIIRAIKEPDQDAMPFVVMAIISAYLIIVPIFGILLKTI